jgi:hypothetical protein
MCLAEPEERAAMLKGALLKSGLQRTLQHQRLPHAAAAGQDDDEEHSEPPPLPEDSPPPSQAPSRGQQAISATPVDLALAETAVAAEAVEAAPDTVPELTGDGDAVQPPLPPPDAAATSLAPCDPFDAAAAESGHAGTSQQVGHMEERKGAGRRRRWGAHTRYVHQMYTKVEQNMGEMFRDASGPYRCIATVNKMRVNKTVNCSELQ